MSCDWRRPEVFMCPRCSGLLRTTDMTRGGYRTGEWSDGLVTGTYGSDPYIRLLKRCPRCQGVYRLDERVDPNKNEQTRNLLRNDPWLDPWNFSLSMEEEDDILRRAIQWAPWDDDAKEQDYLTALSTGLARTKDEEVKYRIAVWWMANDRVRYSIESLQEESFWDQPFEVLDQHVKLIEEYKDAVEERNREWQASEGTWSDAVKAGLMRGIEEGGFDERELSAELLDALSEEDQKTLAVFAACREIPAPEVPDEIESLFYVHGDAEVVREEIKQAKDRRTQAKTAVNTFEYTSEERECLSKLAVSLDGEDNLLRAELLRELGRFDDALEALNRVSPADEKESERKVLLEKWIKEKDNAVKPIYLGHTFEVAW